MADERPVFQWICREYTDGELTYSSTQHIEDDGRPMKAGVGPRHSHTDWPRHPKHSIHTPYGVAEWLINRLKAQLARQR